MLRDLPERAILKGMMPQAISAESEAYPRLLREIPHPPRTLYICGALPKVPCIALVGTRKATEGGRSTARHFASVLAEAGFGIVSGMAMGIDAAAHEGALSAGGYTLAVLGHGPDIVYPAGHRNLKEKILSAGGALLTEYPPGTTPRAFRFLARNRLVSGLCQAVCIIEAPERSGAMATARFAMEQNRDVLVLPGPAGHINFRGSHRLIRDGATLVDSPEDILQELGISPPPGDLSGLVIEPEGRLITDILREAGQPLSIDEIIKRSKLTAPEVHKNITLLVIKNLVQEEAGNYELSYFGF